MNTIDKICDKLIKIEEYVVYLTYGLIMLCEMSRYFQEPLKTYFAVVYRYAGVFAVLLAIARIILFIGKSPKYSIISFVTLIAAFILNYYIDSKYWIFYTAALIIATYKISFENIIITYLSAQGIPFAIKCIGAALGVFANTIETEGVRRMRMDLGFTHHNTGINYFFFLAMAIIYLLYDRVNKLVLLTVITVVSGLLFIATDSITGTVCVLFLVACLGVNLVLERFKFSKIRALYEKIIGIGGICASPGCIIITIAGVLYSNYYMYINNYEAQVNTFMGRFVALSYNITMNGITIPWELNFVGREPNTRFNYITGGMVGEIDDNGYGSLFINYGVVVFTAFVVFMLWWGIKAYKNKQFVLSLLQIVFALQLLMEGVGSRYGWNPFLLLPLTINELTKNEQNRDINVNI